MREEVELLRVGEVELYVEDTGPLGAPALAVVHGGPGGSSYLLREGFGEALEDYRVIYFDQRGSGRSPELPPEPHLFTIDALVEDLEGLREELNIESWGLIAHDFGAVPALEYARRFPDRISHVLLIAPWVHFPKLARQLAKAAGVIDPPEGFEALEAALRAGDPKLLFDQLFFPTQHGRLELEWQLEGGPWGSDRPAQMMVLNGLWELDYTPFLLRHPRPPSVLVGEVDGSSYPEQAEFVADLTSGTLEVIPQAGHYPWIDQPAIFLELLLEHLSLQI